jgi:undecaprenyl-diphosphatase
MNLALFFGSFLNMGARSRLFLAVLSICFVALSLFVHSAPLLSLDHRITREIQKWHGAVLDRIVHWITLLGNPIPYLLVGALAATLLLLRGESMEAFLCLTTLLSLPLNYMVKEIVGRPRPESPIAKILVPVIGKSFPSGHAMTTVVLYGFLAFLAWIHLARSGARVPVTLILATLPFLIGLTRIYLGVHWFSDVVGGWTAGVLVLLLLAHIHHVVVGTT